MNPSLEARVASALDGVDEPAAAALLVDLEAHGMTLTMRHAEADATSLDPRASAVDAQAAAADVSRLEFESKRLARGVTAVREHLASLRKAASDEAARLAIEAVQAERATIRGELEEAYPRVVAELLQLFRRQDRNDSAAMEVRMQHFGAAPIARDGGFDPLRSVLRLPSWAGSSFWPPMTGEQSHPYDGLSDDLPPVVAPPLVQREADDVAEPVADAA